MGLKKFLKNSFKGKEKKHQEKLYKDFEEGKILEITHLTKKKNSSKNKKDARKKQ